MDVAFPITLGCPGDLIGGFLPGPTGRKERPFAGARTMVEGIIYRYRCGIAWRDLPSVFGPWQTVWKWSGRT
jgi:transposase